MLVPLGGGGTPVVNSLMPSMTGENTGTIAQKLRSENMRVSSDVSQEQEKREKSSPNISGNRKRDTTTPLDLTKSQIIEDHELLQRNSISLTVQSADKDIRNRLCLQKLVHSCLIPWPPVVLPRFVRPSLHAVAPLLLPMNPD